ncbi:MAG: hypothetical protein Q4D93_00735 [Porphyromonas sp.]|nr:hypothetical protein [Porphyromonas sp.]
MMEEAKMGSEPQETLIEMEFSRLQSYGSGANEGLLIVLQGQSDTANENWAFTVTVPPEYTKEYEIAFELFKARGIGSESALHAFQRSTGVHIRKVIVNEADVRDRGEAVLFSLTEMGETVSFPAPMHSAVLYAIFNNLPILVERSLAQSAESLRSEEQMKSELISALLEHIQSGTTPANTPLTDEQSSKLKALDSSILQKLLDEAVKVENYEWAHVLQGYIGVNPKL